MKGAIPLLKLKTAVCALLFLPLLFGAGLLHAHYRDERLQSLQPQPSVGRHTVYSYHRDRAEDGLSRFLPREYVRIVRAHR